ncbi:MAG: DUF3108 domain-containing protein [Flammeovirgaceae bacterium TMED290]|nr:MAG: DUF3108 domain-containing protein [Flammeovirgaceae bacterium TMED290]|tara:strand:- start:224 stop:937 length:714 start_codon:yes stop_codon:yes gene_type:complete
MQFIIIFLLISVAYSESSINQFDKQVRYEYNAYVDVLNLKLGEASLSIKKPDNIKGTDVYHLNFSVKTSKLGDTIYKIRNKIDVWINKESFNIVKQYKNISELRKKKTTTTFINGNKGETNGRKYIVNDNVFDPYSLILILSEFDIPINSSKKFNIVDAGKIRELEVKNLGFKTIRTPYGKFSGYTLSPIQNGQRVLKNKGDMEVSYASIDGTLVPIEIIIKLGQGVITLKLKKVLE